MLIDLKISLLFCMLFFMSIFMKEYSKYNLCNIRLRSSYSPYRCYTYSNDNILKPCLLIGW